MRICFVTPRFPYPPHKGDSMRVFQQLRSLSSQHRLTLLALSDRPIAADDLACVEQLCERVHVVELPAWRRAANLVTGVGTRMPLQVRYYRSAQFQRVLDRLLARERFDVLHTTLLRMLPYVWGVSSTKVVVDLVDSISLNLASRREQIHGLARLAYELEYRRVQVYERRAVERFEHIAVSSPADRRQLGQERVRVIPNGVDLERFPYADGSARAPRRLVFTGNMGYQPNEAAVAWFGTEVWPLVLRRHPGLRFEIVGTNPTTRVRSLEKLEGIDVLGRVPDVAERLHEAALAVCPMRSGSGIQNKVLEAMAAGTPVVASSIANRGVGATPGRDLLVADGAADTAAHVERLLESADLRRSLSQAGRAFVAARFCWEEHAKALLELYSGSYCAAASSRRALATSTSPSVSRLQ